MTGEPFAMANLAVPSPLLAGIRDGAWLDRQEFPPLAYAVPGVIPEGSVLLVGPPKIGKSWFVLAMALAVASGGKMLGQDVPQRPTLYLALEDGHRRLQDRCRKLLEGEPIPGAFEYLTAVEPGRVLDTVAAWLELQTTPPLVVLDTLGRVMPPAVQGESSYQRDYRVGAAVKRLADERPGMTLLVNHHDRKANAEDFVDSVSGTHGLAGAADTIVVLTRPRLEEDGTLRVTGRDVPEGEYAVRFVDGMAWTLDGASLQEAAKNASEARATAGLGSRATEIFEAVATMEYATPKDLADELGLDPHVVRTYLARLVESGRLVRVRRGLYAPTPPVASVASVALNGQDPTERNNATHATPTDPGRWAR